MDAFAALADPVRRDLLRRLARGPARVVDLAAEHPISRPAVSKHLRLLSDAGLVTADDRGRERHYRTATAGLAPVRALLDELREQGYDAVVLVAHSQGSALSAAALCGDRYRRDPEGAAPWGDEFGVLPWPPDDRPARVTGLMTFGCPVRQLYEADRPGYATGSLLLTVVAALVGVTAGALAAHAALGSDHRVRDGAR